MEETMSKEDDALEWLRFVEMDLRAVEIFLEYHPFPIEIICFYCHEAAEKCLKAILVMQRIRPPKTHVLKELYDLCEPYVPAIQTIGEACTFLGRYNVSPTYPSELKVTVQDAHTSISYAKAIVGFLSPMIHA
jgi:HEPN domain-containing protein